MEPEDTEQLPTLLMTLIEERYYAHGHVRFGASAFVGDCGSRAQAEACLRQLVQAGLMAEYVHAYCVEGHTLWGGSREDFDMGVPATCRECDIEDDDDDAELDAHYSFDLSYEWLTKLKERDKRAATLSLYPVDVEGKEQWVIHWLDVDLCYQADTMADALREMARVVAAHKVIAEVEGREPFVEMERAPDECWRRVGHRDE